MKSASVPTRYQSSHINTHHRCGGEFDVKRSARLKVAAPPLGRVTTSSFCSFFMCHRFVAMTAMIYPWSPVITQSSTHVHWAAMATGHMASPGIVTNAFPLWDIQISIHCLESKGFSNLLISRTPLLIFIYKKFCHLDVRADRSLTQACNHVIL